MAGEFHIFDTKLRDGAQGEGINFPVPGGLPVARFLDEFGVLRRAINGRYTYGLLTVLDRGVPVAAGTDR